jgi:hypothetical protein
MAASAVSKPRPEMVTDATYFAWIGLFVVVFLFVVMVAVLVEHG